MLDRLARATESEEDELGISATEAESEAPEPGPRVARPSDDADLREYGRILGANMEEADMPWLVREAFEAPLPLSWTEHVDGEGRVYFFNQVTQESSWAHPMDGVYRELIGLVQTFRAERPAALPEPRVQAVKEHLEQVHKCAVEQLEGWSGPYVSDSGQYFYNESDNVSSWVNPVEEWDYELAIRQSVLHRCLLPDFADLAAADASGGNGEKESMETTFPRLQLPVGLAHARDDEAASSARSFYTARESSRSGNSERSLYARGDAMQSPSRVHKQGGERAAAPQASNPSSRPLESCREEVSEGEAAFDSREPLDMPMLGAT